ncbi:MAG TPA: LLM class F420-dependent oxidoreductase [Anaerolineales bacterium]|nr:LLM class F420-dependent oxidoreductase [Anaerolineales bacterium]
MRISLQVPNFTYPGGPSQLGATLAAIARAAEEAGFYSLWVMDHFFQIGDPGRVSTLGPPEDEMLESYSTLSYFAGVTRRIKLGALVTGVIYRYPGILIKTVTTLDVLSGGRAIFGLGAAWNELESRSLGVPFPPPKERLEREEETLQIALQMWSGSDAPFKGRYYHLERTLCSPLPLSQPHPPIMIGGMGEQKTLRLVAQYADACNLFTRAGADTLRHKLEALQRHCDRLGRDYSTIEKTTLNTVHLAPDKASPKDVVEECRALAALGIQHCIFNMPDTHEITPIETFGREIIPAIADL